ncbi:MAG: hypothetical protein IPK27_07470 [Rhodanobacteraceae bacterium]|nr:hypothetical protein [Rhodanobacteraceae bacterium]
MSILWWLAYAALAGFSALICGYTLLALARADRRIRWRQFSPWRLLGALPFLALAIWLLESAERTTLRCERTSGVIHCEVLRDRLRVSEVAPLAPGTLQGAELDERSDVDSQGDVTTHRRVALVTREGRKVLTRWDQGDALRMRDEIVAFLGDPRQRALDAAADNRPFHYLTAPIWLALAALVLIGRWD